MLKSLQNWGKSLGPRGDPANCAAFAAILVRLDTSFVFDNVSN